ncbi:MAG: ABC transporter substrate-binding protein [bacterium]
MQNKKTYWFIAIVVILIIILVIAGKSGTSSKIKVGAVLPMSGFGKLYGEETQKGFTLCKADNTEFVIEDSQALPAVGVSAFNKIVSTNKPDAIVVMMSSVAEATLPLAKSYNGPVIATGVSSVNIAERGGDRYFRYFSRGEKESVMNAEYLLNTLKIKKLGVLYLNADYGKTYVDGVNSVYKDKGEVITESFNTGTTDFKTNVAKLKAKNVEAIYIVGYDNDLELSIKDIKTLKYKGIIFGNSIFNNLMAKGVDKNILDGVYFSTLNFYTGERKDSFFADYKAKYGTEANWYAASGCDIARQLGQVKGKDVMGYYKNLKSYEGINGKIFANGREFEFPEGVALYKDGKFEVMQAAK